MSNNKGYFQSLISIENQFSPKELKKIGKPLNDIDDDSAHEIQNVIQVLEAEQNVSTFKKLHFSPKLISQHGDNNLSVDDVVEDVESEKLSNQVNMGIRSPPSEFDQKTFSPHDLEIDVRTLTDPNKEISPENALDTTEKKNQITPENQQNTNNLKETIEFNLPPAPPSKYKKKRKLDTEIKLSTPKLVCLNVKYTVVGLFIVIISNVIAFPWKNKIFDVIQIFFAGIFYGFSKSTLLIHIVSKTAESGIVISGQYASLKTSTHRIYERRPFYSTIVLNYLIQRKLLRFLNLFNLSSANIIEATFVDFKVRIFIIFTLFSAGCCGILGYIFIYQTVHYNEFTLLSILAMLFISDTIFTFVYFSFKRCLVKQRLKIIQKNFLANRKYYTEFIKEINSTKYNIMDEKKKKKMNEIVVHKANKENEESSVLTHAKKKKENLVEYTEIQVVQKIYEQEEDKILKFESLHQLLNILNFLNNSTIIKFQMFIAIFFVYFLFNVFLGSIYVMMSKNTISLYLFYLCYIASPGMMIFFQEIIKYISFRTDVKIRKQSLFYILLSEIISYRILLYLTITNSLYSLFLTIIKFIVIFILFYQIAKKGNEINLEHIERLRKLTRISTQNVYLKKKIEKKQTLKSKKSLDVRLSHRKSIFASIRISNIIEGNKRDMLNTLYTFVLMLTLQLVTSFLFIFQYLFHYFAIWDVSSEDFPHRLLVLINIIVTFIIELLVFFFGMFYLQKRQGYVTLHFTEMIQRKIFYCYPFQFFSAWILYYYVYLLIYNSIYFLNKSPMEGLITKGNA